MRSPRLPSRFLIGASKHIDRRMAYYHEGHEEHEGFVHKLRALRELRGFRILTDEAIDWQNLVAA